MPGADPGYGRLRRRSEFVEVSKGLRCNRRAFSLQAAHRNHGGEARFGFTVTKRTGTAVERTRMRRRLKEAIRTIAALPVRQGHDYVFVVRRDALITPFAELSTQIVHALAEMGSKLDRSADNRRQVEVADAPMKVADRL